MSLPLRAQSLAPAARGGGGVVLADRSASSDGSVAPPSTNAPMRILLVDDEKGMCTAFRRILTRKGFVVDIALDGLEALRLFREGSYDAILSDIGMPKVDGLELLHAVRAHDADIPVILMTGVPSVQTAAKAVEYGALQYLTKPIDIDELIQSLTKAARLHRMSVTEQRAVDLLRPSDRVGLAAQLDSAIESLWMAFQPIVSAKDGTVFAHEALLRSAEPALLTPPAVLDAAERLNRLAQVGRVVRERAALPMTNAAPGSALFVNLHPRDLFDPDLIDEDAPLTRIARRVVLEITERASLDTGEHVRERIGLLRRLGFRIAIDDLGAGYAGLSALAMLEPDIIKLDMSLVRDVHLSRTKQKLIRSMTALAKEMGMLVVAEGIEVAAERDTVVRLGCDYLQGYFFAKPGRPFPTVSW